MVLRKNEYLAKHNCENREGFESSIRFLTPFPLIYAMNRLYHSSLCPDHSRRVIPHRAAEVHAVA